MSDSKVAFTDWVASLDEADLTDTGNLLLINAAGTPKRMPWSFGYHTATVVGSTSGSWVLNEGLDQLAYIKFGKLVHIQGELDITSELSPVDYVRVSLPFAVANLTEYGEVGVGSASLEGHGGTLNATVQAYFQSGQSYFTLKYVLADGNAYIVDAEMIDAAWQLIVNFNYICA